ncbi:Hsp20/alpha crystallin family protein [Roseateles koreensis]|uniref:Hsp20/alpha crystallin family protein n=1 Tax=Roseateles koreensis TaxID=2987526 RepID=A0ABT5KRN6_9BURK|nr:Hsp20/alpha crystallin family protein [Roseateles koreensis]MDC8785120.1 Hsp20/alpha crystallin family protein [Roseateles koreensis]
MFVFPVTSRPTLRHRQASELSAQIERMFNGQDEGAVALRSPALDAAETDLAYILQLDMPGVTKEAVKIAIDGRHVSIDGEQSKPEPAAENAPRALHRERAVTRFSRKVTLPQELNQTGSTARLENGVLTLTLLKREASGPSHLTVS